MNTILFYVQLIFGTAMLAVTWDDRRARQRSMWANLLAPRGPDWSEGGPHAGNSFVYKSDGWAGQSGIFDFILNKKPDSVQRIC
jgi:hypothetical protein